MVLEKKIKNANWCSCIYSTLLNHVDMSFILHGCNILWNEQSPMNLALPMKSIQLAYACAIRESGILFSNLYYYKNSEDEMLIGYI